MQSVKRSQSLWVMVVAAVVLFAASWAGVRGWPLGMHAVSAAQGAVAGQSVGPSAGAAAALLRSLAFPAYALASDPANANLTRVNDGLRWKFAGASANLILPRPPDWDGVSNVQIRLFFYPNASTGGTVQFFVRPRTYDPGDTYRDASGELSDLVSVTTAGRFGLMTITIPAARFGTRSWWYLVFQRNFSGTGAPTYPDDVTLMSVAIGYTAVSPLSSAFLPYAGRQ